MSTLDILGSGLAATEGPGLADFNTRGGFFFFTSVHAVFHCADILK